MTDDKSDKPKTPPAVKFGPIWAGVYSRFDEVPVVGPGFMGDIYIERSKQRINRAREDGARFQEHLLPVVVAMVAAGLNRPVVVLDVGGGPGNAYPAVRAALPPSTRLDFHVIENERVCAIGQGIFPPPGISFHEKIPVKLACDVAHIGSALQYIDDWKSFIHGIATVKAPHLLLSDTFAGDIPSFVTGEHYYGSVLPCRFLNLEELVSTVEAEGYRLIMKTEFDRTMLGRRDPLPLEALPPKYRLSYAHHLLFQKA